MQRVPFLTILVGLALAAATSTGAATAAEPRPIVPTDRMAEPAQPAQDFNSSKHFLKTEPSRAPRLSPKPEGVGPILAPLSLKGHRDSPPTTTAPLTPERRIPMPQPE